jgi:hypothetical protein
LSSDAIELSNVTLLVPDPTPELGEVVATRLLGTVLGLDPSAAQSVADLYARNPLTGMVVDDQLSAAVEQSTSFEVTEQVRLPVTANVRPDLSIVGRAGTDDLFQLLIEVKLAASFHDITVNHATLVQPAGYVAAWRSIASADPDLVCRVGVLQKDRGAHNEDWRLALAEHRSDGTVSSDTPSDIERWRLQRDERLDQSPVQATEFDRAWIDILAVIAGGITARLEREGDDHGEPVGPTVLMGWLLHEMYAWSFPLPDGRRRYDADVADIAKALGVISRRSHLEDARNRINRGRPDDRQVKALSQSAVELLRGILTRPEIVTHTGRIA